MKVLIAMDESDNATKALEWYFSNVHKEGNEVILYSYTEPPRVPKTAIGGVSTMSKKDIAEMSSEHEDRCAKKKKKLAEKCEKIKANAQVIVDTKQGGPGKNIIKAAEEHGVNAIVTGTRGQGAISRTVFGSVSNYVLHHSHVPVFICRNS